MQVITDGLLTQYEITGKGQVLVILHGWGDSGKGFLELRTALSKKYQVIQPDLPGFGGSQAPPHAWGLNDYVAFIAHFLVKINCTKTLSFIGHSNGGAIAVRGIAEGSFQPEKLVLLASAGIRDQDNGRKTAVKIIAKTGKTLSAPLPLSIQKKLRQKLYKTVKSDMLSVEHMQSTFKQIVSDDIQNDAKMITIPTLLIYGEEDDQTPVRFGEQLHELIKDSTLEILPGAGHFVQLDRPHQVKTSIEGFLQ